MKTNTLKKSLISSAFIIIATLVFTSCTDDSGTTPQACADYNFYGLQVNNFNNTGGQLDYIQNTSSDVNNPGIQVLSSLQTTQRFNSNHPAFDRANETLYFIDETNGGGQMFIADPNALNQVPLSPAANYGVPVFVGNQLYALEFDVAGIYLNIVTATGAATRIGGIIGANNFFMDPVGNRGYGVLSDSGSLLFLIGNTLYEVATSGTVLNTITVPTTNTEYLDIETDPDTGGLFLAKWESGLRSIVHWDISAGTIVESTIISNIEFNRESVNLAFNNCGNRLLVLSNGTFINNVQENSRIWEIEVQNSPSSGTILNTNSFTSVLLGLIY